MKFNCCTVHTDSYLKIATFRYDIFDHLSLHYFQISAKSSKVSVLKNCWTAKTTYLSRSTCLPQVWQEQKITRTRSGLKVGSALNSISLRARRFYVYLVVWNLVLCWCKIHIPFNISCSQYALSIISERHSNASSQSIHLLSQTMQLDNRTLITSPRLPFVTSVIPWIKSFFDKE